ncbi:MAG TPA: phage tail tape measure protein [bacterium]|nr:phage tail tape measure protein [bacterium]
MNGDLGLGLIVSMKDAFSQNAARIQSSMMSLDGTVAASSERMTKNLDRIQKGTMMIGAGLALMAMPAALIASTAATQKALGEMASLGTKDLRALEDAAESFTNTWAGSSKAEFIGAAYDVKSALANLSDEAVGTFSAMAALTAKATKASIQEMVGTFTTGYGIFKPIMADMTDMEWAKAFSGGMAQTVAVFKTTGAGMAEAIKNIGAVAASSNIPLAEQMAILGQLQTTMPGSEAGTLYKAFIMKAAEASNELGVSLVDSSGRLKGIIPILEEIKKKYPDLSQAAAQVEIKKAFGSDEAVKFLLQMSQGMEALGGNIRSIEQAMKSGTAVTEEMARAMNMDIGSQFQLVRQQVSNLFEILGRTLLPVVIPVIQGVSQMILFLQKLAKSMPGVTRAVLTFSMALGAVLVVVGGVIAAVGTIGVALPAIKAGIVAMGASLSGVGAAIATYFLPVVAVIGGVILAVYLLKRAWETNFAGIRDTVMGAWNKVQLVFQGIRTLISSLKDGTGQMSADLAQKLEAAGLMGLVTTVFRIYYRVRQFLAGLHQAFAHAFERIGAILGPAVRSLLQAYGALYKAIFSVIGIFGMAATSADASTYKKLGQALGTVIGVIAQVGAFIVKCVINQLVFVIKVVTAVVRAVVWMATTIIGAFIAAAQFVFKFFLPLRLLVQALQLAARAAYIVWQVLSGDISVLEGLKSFAGAVFDYLATPFFWVRDIIVAVWESIKGLFLTVGTFFKEAAGTIASAFMNLPLVRMLADVIGTARSFFAGDVTFLEAGKRMMFALGKGILAAATYPFTMLKNAIGYLRRLLPFSDAETGPLSTLTASGAALLKTFSLGMMGTVFLPAKVLGLALKGVLAGAVFIRDRLKTLGSGIISSITQPFSKGTELASTVWQKIKGPGAGIIEALAAPFQTLGNTVNTLWQGVSNAAANFWTGLRDLAGSAWSQISSPFSMIADTATAAWSRITNGASSAWGRLKSMAATASSWIRAPFEGVASIASTTWEKIKAGITDWGKSGIEMTRRGIAAGGESIGERVSVPFKTARAAELPKLPKPEIPIKPSFSLPKVQEVIKALGSGINTAVQLPVKVIERATEVVGSPMKNLAAPALLAGTLVLTPVLSGAIPEIGGPAPVIAGRREAIEPLRPTERQSQLLAETRGALTSGPREGASGAPPENLASILEAILAKLDAVSDRPIDLRVTTTLDGRQIAQAVYKDLRERKVKNYETS